MHIMLIPCMPILQVWVLGTASAMGLVGLRGPGQTLWLKIITTPRHNQHFAPLSFDTNVVHSSSDYEVSRARCFRCQKDRKNSTEV